MKPNRHGESSFQTMTGVSEDKELPCAGETKQHLKLERETLGAVLLWKKERTRAKRRRGKQRWKKIPSPKPRKILEKSGEKKKRANTPKKNQSPTHNKPQLRFFASLSENPRHPFFCLSSPFVYFRTSLSTPKRSKMDQDWTVVKLKKKPQKLGKSESDINQARRQGAQIETVKKCNYFFRFPSSSFWKC
jgi:hypothetical protein